MSNAQREEKVAINSSTFHLQHIEVLSSMEKQRRLEQILRSNEPGSKIIIFCSTKKMCDQLSRNLTRNFGAAAIHGDKSQGERDYVLSQFRTGRSPVLVATDVAARGLDIKDIRLVPLNIIWLCIVQVHFLWLNRKGSIDHALLWN